MSLSDLQERHGAYLQRYGSYTNNQVISLLEKSERRLTSQISELLDDLKQNERQAFLRGSYTTRRLIRLRDSVRELAQAAVNSTREVLAENGKALADYEIRHTGKILEAAGVQSLGTSVTANQAYAAAMSKPMLGVHVRDWVSDLDTRFKRQTFAAIREGFVLGESTGRIVKRIKGTPSLRGRDGLFFTRKNAIEAVVRTSLAHMANVAKVEELKQAGVKKYYLSVVFDGRTSKICAAWNPGGLVKLYDLNGNNPKPPFHPNCRTIIGFPVNGDVKKPFVADSRPVSKIPKDERSGKIGQTTSKTYAEFFDNQSAAFQKEWLGAKKYRLYKEGNYKIDRFVDPTGKQYSIADLERLDGETFAELGL